MTQHHGIFHHLRKCICKRADAIVVPGSLAKLTIRSDWGVEEVKFLELPNLVDETQFRDVVAAHRCSRVAPPEQPRIRLFTSARLHEAEKGLVSFLSRCVDMWDPGFELLVAGTGPDAEFTAAWLRSNGMDRYVHLVGHQSTDNLLRLLAGADAFLLPSLKDPNPLSAVEAAWARLPLWLSDRCGNATDLVEDGVNGWTFDPIDAGQVRRAMNTLFSTSMQQLQSMGRASLARAEQRFATDAVVSRLLQEITGLIN